MASLHSIFESMGFMPGLHWELVMLVIDEQDKVDKLVKDLNYGSQLQRRKKEKIDRVLYRACLKEQDINKDIVSKAIPGTPDANRTVEQHIASGSKKPSRFISTTASPAVASKWATDGQPIIEIHLSKMAGMKELDEMIDLTNTAVRERFLKGAINRNRAKSSQEVLFQWRIPKKNPKGEDVFQLWGKPKSF